jgi:hypothetical protein
LEGLRDGLPVSLHLAGWRAFKQLRKS